MPMLSSMASPLALPLFWLAPQSGVGSAGPYRDAALIVWSLQLVFSGALTIVFIGLTLRLGRPLMPALAMLWALRTLLAATLLPFFTTTETATASVVLLSALYGAVALTLIPGARWVIDEAMADGPSVPGVVRWPHRWWWWTLAGFVVGALLHTANIRTGFSERFGAGWTRLLVLVSLVYLFAGLWRGRQRVGAGRATRRALLLGSGLLLVTTIIDSLLRFQLLPVFSPEANGLLSLANGLTGSLIFAVLCIVAAVEGEREALAADEQRLADAAVRAAEAQRLQSLGALASGIAHDFNNVLSVIISGAQLAELTLDEDVEAARADIEEVRRAGVRGTGLAGRLLTFARRQTDTRITFDPAQTVADLLPMLQRLIDPRVTLETTLVRGYRIDWVPTQLEQVVLNLVVNARDAIPAQGRITLALTVHQELAGRPMTLGTLLPGHWLCLSVSDTGTGMDSETRRRLFEPFFTTKGARGTGLGLPTVASAIRDIGGALELYSAIGAGTRVEVWLPLVA